MAEQATPALYSVKNTQPSPRGIWSDGVLSYVDPDAVVLAELTDEDKAAAEKTGYFEIKKATDAEKKAAGVA